VAEADERLQWSLSSWSRPWELCSNGG